MLPSLTTLNVIPDASGMLLVIGPLAALVATVVAAAGIALVAGVTVERHRSVPRPVADESPTVARAA